MKTTTWTRYSPAQWRVLNHLFAVNSANVWMGRLMNEQDASLGEIVALERAALIEAYFEAAGTLPVEISALRPGSVGSLTLRLTPKGHGRVVNNAMNNIVSALSNNLRLVSTARVVKVEADVDDEALKAAEDLGLIEGNLPLATFREIPATVQLKLTRKGRNYFPR